MGKVSDAIENVADAFMPPTDDATISNDMKKIANDVVDDRAQEIRSEIAGIVHNEVSSIRRDFQSMAESLNVTAAGGGAEQADGVACRRSGSCRGGRLRELLRMRPGVAPPAPADESDTDETTRRGAANRKSPMEGGLVHTIETAPDTARSEGVC